jgi:hypothetical protein
VLTALLCLLPTLALVLPLLLRRYPGERLLTQLSQRAQRRWPRPRSSAGTARRMPVVVVRGGLLLGRSLAVRPPPAACLAR